jgi:D-galactarolactone cycloisomerase
VLRSPIEHAGGTVRIPDGPGLGIAVDRDALERFAVKHG